MSTLDAYASHRHLVDHLLPVWAALPPEHRGKFHVAHRHLVAHCRDRGIEAAWAIPQGPGPLTLVASHPDYSQVHPERPIAYLEHGAGQTYLFSDRETEPWHPSYSGGTGRDRVRLFLTLNETTAARERARYPEAEVVVVGSPRADALPSRQVDSPTGGTGRSSGRPVVAFAWHWDCSLIPETRSTWPYWRHAVAAAAADGVHVIGHGHPRLFASLVPWYERHGIEPVRDLAEVCARADLVAFDNTSAGLEAAAAGLPVLFLSAPTYRRGVVHGGRFWDWPAGQVTCDTTDRLEDAITEALADTPDTRDARARMIAAVYPPHTRG